MHSIGKHLKLREGKKPILSLRAIQVIITLFILGSVAIIMYPPDMAIFRRTSEFAVHLMIGLLVLGLVFLVFNQTRLMFVAMLASGFLAFFLKTASNSNLVLPTDNNLPKLKVAHFNLSSLQPFDPEFTKKINALDHDLISFQEYTPVWDSYIFETLKASHPYSQKIVRIDLFGMAIYSKVPLGSTSIFYYEDIPNINVKVNTGLQDVNVLSSYLAPPGFLSGSLNPEQHLEQLAQYISDLKGPSIALGDYNQVYWTNEIKSFRDKTEMSNSRRNISLTSKVPYDHIFYSNLLECIEFDEIKNIDQGHLGIAATFQAKTSIVNPAILRSVVRSD